MIELIKKSLMAGVGAAVVTKDKIEESLGEFVRQGKVTAEDARKMAEKVAAEGRKEFHEACVELGGKLRTVTAQADEKTKGQVSALTKRLQALEQRLAGSGGGAKPGRAKPAPSARRVERDGPTAPARSRGRTSAPAGGGHPRAKPAKARRSK